ncbi:recombinase family protein [Streptomyces sp. NPDC047097]|uniref:recombinase family protein n=1 Tax=Streptomyces sp. NPDC047097 TaxID=3155260 RepID=UPI0033E22938
MHTARNHEVAGFPAADETGPSDLDLCGSSTRLAAADKLDAVPGHSLPDRLLPDLRRLAQAQPEEGGHLVVGGQQGRREPAPAQRQELGRHDAVLAHRYTDNDLSASKRGIMRPEFQAMLRDLRRGQTAEGYPDTASSSPTRTACRARTETGQSALHLTDGVVGALSTLAPLALAGSVHLYILMARTAEAPVRDEADQGSGPVRCGSPLPDGTSPQLDRRPLKESISVSARGVVGGPPATGAVAGVRPNLQEGSPWRTPDPSWVEARRGPAADPDGVRTGPMHVDRRSDSVADRGSATAGPTAGAATAPATVRASADGEEPPVRDSSVAPVGQESEEGWLEDLLPIGGSASERAGRISRDAVKTAVRAHQPIGNDRLGVLPAQLRHEQKAVPDAPARAHEADREACAPGHHANVHPR